MYGEPHDGRRPPAAKRGDLRHAFVIHLAFGAACGHAPATSTQPAAVDDAVAQLEAELRASPTNGAVIYALATRHDRLGHVAEALARLEELARTPWDAGVDPADFVNSRARAAARYDAAQTALEQRWVQAPRAKERVRIGERDLLPEGMERDPGSGELLLSSGRKRKVVRVAPDGTTRDVVAPGQDGLLATLGLRVDGARGLLWVANAAAPFMEHADDTPPGRSRLHAFELATGRLRARYELPGPSLLNDVVVLPDGRAVVTDSVASGLWITGEQRLEPLLPAGTLSDPNGLVLSANGDLLYVATWRGIAVVDWRTRRAAPLQLPAGATNLAGIDGLYLHAGALVGIQNAVGHPRVVQLPLTADGRGAIRVDVIESGSAIVDNPTTGVVVDGELVFLARRNREGAFATGAAAPGTLAEIVVATVSLTGH